MAKIYLDPGHGGHDPGAVGKRSKEKGNVLKVAKKIKVILENYGHTVKLTRSSDVFVSLSNRAKLANDWGADVFVSLHNNSATATATGFETFIYNGSVSDKTKQLQTTVHNAIAKSIGIRDRGKKRANFAVVRQTKMPAILIEYAFISNSDDEKILIDEVDKLADLTADGIVDFVGGKITAKSSKKSSKPTKKPSNNNLGLVDYMKSKNMDSSYNNRKKLAAQYGIKNYSGTAKQNTDLLNKLKAGKPKSNKPVAKLKVDGYMGKLTISALQRYFGTIVDGVISKPSLVIKALQKLLGVKQDGYFGPITIKALQKRFGTVQDGVISKPSLVIKELQRRLNRGKL